MFVLMKGLIDLAAFAARSSSRNRIRRAAVLYEDEHLIAIDKPVHVPVHGGSGVPAGETVLERLNVGLSGAFRLCHRLDASTSGVLILARTGEAARLMERGFAGRLVRKTYWAVCVPETRDRFSRTGRISAPVGGKPALTEYTVLESSQIDHARCFLVELAPETGRKHQLRLHCANQLLAPILGDTRYGVTRRGHQKTLLDWLRSSEVEGWRGTRPSLFLHHKTVRVPYIEKKNGLLSLSRDNFVRIDAPIPQHFKAVIGDGRHI
jgi:23S rRNA-/tRNA-specific pseudouridylate synthase